MPGSSCPDPWPDPRRIGRDHERGAGGRGERLGIVGAAGLAWEGLLDLVLPADCAACGAGVYAGGGPAPSHGRRVVAPPACPDCLAEVEAARFTSVVTGRPRPALVGHAPPTWSAAEYGGALAHLVVAHKDGGRRDARAVLAPLLAHALRAAVDAVSDTTSGGADAPPLLVVAAPSRPRAVRSRGERPVADLARAAAGRVALDVLPALAHRRGVADQSGLGRTARRRNLAGALRVPAGHEARVRGADCVVVDDVTTSGATLAECARALHAAGAGLVVGATVAATP